MISEVFYVGLGSDFDASKLEAYPPGALIILPGNTPHLHWARSGECVTQITVVGRSDWNTSARKTIRATPTPTRKRHSDSAKVFSSFAN